MSMVRSIFAVVFFISSIGSASAADDLKSFLLELQFFFENSDE